MTSTFTVFNTTTVYNTAAATQLRYRTNQQTFSFFSCSAGLAAAVYRVLGSGNSSAQVIQVNDFLYTNSGGTSALSAGNYGIGDSAISGADFQITVGNAGRVTGALSCGGDGGFGEP